MGMFDRIIIHNTEYQTKAFGKSLKIYGMFDVVKIHRAAFTEDEYNSANNGDTLTNKYDLSAYQVECYGTKNAYEYLTIINHRIIRVGERNTDLPLYNYYGKLVDLGERLYEE